MFFPGQARVHGEYEFRRKFLSDVDGRNKDNMGETVDVLVVGRLSI